MAKTKKINQETRDLEDQVIQAETKWKRALADYQNLQKRTQVDRVRFIKLANVNLIEKILTIVDDLERAAGHIEDKGIDMIVKQFSSTLKEEGVEEILSQDQVFDPIKMECVEIVGGEKDMVMGVAQKGYMIDDQVLRPAKVEVGGGIDKNTNNTN